VGATPKSTDAQRAKWREKNRRAYARRMAKERGEPDPFPDTAVVDPAGAGPVAPSPGDPVPVPWDASILEPLFRAIVPEVEKLDIAALKAKAAPLGEELVRMVEKEAGWNPVAKTTVTTTGPAVVAQVLNSVGISSAHAPALALVGAIGAILTGRQILAAKLEELATAQQPKPAAP